MENDFDDFGKEEKLFKKMKKGKITKEQYDLEMDKINEKIEKQIKL